MYSKFEVAMIRCGTRTKNLPLAPRPEQLVNCTGSPVNKRQKGGAGFFILCDRL